MASEKDFQQKLELIGQNFLLKLKADLVNFSEFFTFAKINEFSEEKKLEIADKFHKIVGIAKMVGFEEIGKLARKFEEGLKKEISQADFDELKQFFVSFYNESEALIKEKLTAKKRHDFEKKNVKKRKYQVLIADDNELMRDLLKEALRDIDCDVFEAFDGKEAIEYVNENKNNKPDLIILDVNMPKKSGFEVLDELKSSNDTKNIPTVLLTRREEDKSIVRGISSGAIDYIKKPFDVEELKTRILEILQNNQKKILIADDDAMICDLLEGNFLRLGYLVFLANNGKKALEIAKKEKPNIAIIDYMMPAMDGISFIKEVKKTNEISSMEIIMLSAKSQQENILLGLKSGASDYVTKPFDIEELSQRVERILQRG